MKKLKHYCVCTSTSIWLPNWISIRLHFLKMLAWEREADGRRETVAHRRKDGEARQQKNVLAGWHGYTSFLYGLDQADEGWGSRLRRCELLTQVRHRNSWNNNTNHCYTSGTKPLKGHGGAPALTRAQLTGSSWRYTACIMLWVYIKSTRNAIKYDKVDFSVHLARSTPVLAKEQQQLESILHLIHRSNMKLVMHISGAACSLGV